MYSKATALPMGFRTLLRYAAVRLLQGYWGEPLPDYRCAVHQGGAHWACLV